MINYKNNIDLVNTLLSSDAILLQNSGGHFEKIQFSDFQQYLANVANYTFDDVAFYVDINKASTTSTSTVVDRGGSSYMKSLWTGMWKMAIMSPSGHFSYLSGSNNCYTSDGTKVMNYAAGLAADGATAEYHYNLLSSFSNCNVMGQIPKTYFHAQEITVGSVTFYRLWFSIVAFGNQNIIPEQWVGIFKGKVDANGKLRSIPNAIPTGNKTIYQFWQAAQLMGTNYGLANGDFQTQLHAFLFANYGSRDIQNATKDGSVVFGPSLDGSENTKASASDGFTRQQGIVTGATLSLTAQDGNVGTIDGVGGNVHVSRIGYFEGVYGQYWEMRCGMASLANDAANNVYLWKTNFCPSSAPTADTFANIPCQIVTRSTVGNSKWCIGDHLLSCVPTGSGISGISTGDAFYYDAAGQLWLWGGDSAESSGCGLSDSASTAGWTSSASDFAARLAFFGNAVERTGAQLLSELTA